VPSPKSHDSDVIEPVDRLLNATDNGAVPLVGEAPKSAAGGCTGEVTVIRFGDVSVLEPPGPVTVRLTV